MNNTALNIETVQIRDLRVYERNAREHSDAQVDALAKNIKTFGFVVPLTIDASNVVIAGHGRLRAARQVGLTELPCVRITHLDEDQIKALRLADNALSERSDWDRTLLRQELQDLQALGLADLSGFDADELSSILEPWSPTPTEPVSKTTGPIVTRPGDLWVLGDHRLLCGDSTSPADVARLMDGERAHCVNIDPPYGVSYVGKTKDALTIANDKHRDDDLIQNLLLPSFKLALQHSREDAAWYVWHATSTRRDFEHAMDAAGLVEHQMLTWVKPQFVLGRSHYQWGSEPCFYLSRQGTTPPFYGDRCESTIWRVACTDATGTPIVSVVGGVRISDGSGGEIFITHKPAKGKKTRLFRLEQGDSLCLASPNGAATDTWEIDRPSANKDHPTEKPPQLAINAILNSTRPGEIVLDLYGGSGFTLIGAEKSERRARIMELDPRYADVICRRWSEMTGKSPIREGDGVSYADLVAAGGAS